MILDFFFLNMHAGFLSLPKFNSTSASCSFYNGTFLRNHQSWNILFLSFWDFPLCCALHSISLMNYVVLYLAFFSCMGHCWLHWNDWNIFAYFFWDNLTWHGFLTNGYTVDKRYTGSCLSQNTSCSFFLEWDRAEWWLPQCLLQYFRLNFFLG